jgi:hypothetical protein
MAMSITRESDPILVEQLVLCIHSVPGIGKTSLGFTADDAINLDFDKGVYRSGNRKDSVRPECWADVDPLAIKALLAPYKTIVVDTAGRALDLLTADIIEEEPKFGRGGALSLQGFGVLRNRFVGWLSAIKAWGKDVVLLAHSDEKQKGDEVIERLDVQGGSKNEIYKSSDVMGRLSIRDGKQWLTFSPTETAFGKNPANLPPLKVPDFREEPNFLGQVIRQIKATINEQSEGQRQAAAFLDSWRAKLDACLTSTDFDRAREEAGAAECSEPVRAVIKSLIRSKADAVGFVWDSKAKAFAAK